MRKYRVTEQNVKMINGMLRKFKESCANKGHCFKYGRTPIFPFLTLEQAKECGKYFPVVTAIQMAVRIGDVVEFCGGNRITIKEKHRPPLVIKRIVPKNPQIKDAFIYKLDHPPMARLRKRYGSTIQLTKRDLINEGALLNSMRAGMCGKQRGKNQRNDIVELWNYLVEHKFSDSVIAEVLSNATMAQIIPPKSMSSLDFDDELYANAHSFASTGCEAMFMDD